MKLHLCKKCNAPLVVGENWTEAGKRHWQYYCKQCNLDRQTEYRRNGNGRSTYLKYNQSEKGKIKKRELLIAYALTENGKTKNREKVRRYHKTPNGLEVRIRAENKRRRSLGFIKMFPNPFPKSIEIEWHHVTNDRVVALPWDIHNECRVPDAGLHRRKCWQYVRQIYGTDHQIAFV